MTINLDRGICCDLNETITREWLITNGLGGYAAGTVAGVLTRKQHGLLVARLSDTARPELLLAKIDEEVSFDQRTYYLGTNEYQNGILSPAGFVHLEGFRIEDGIPVFNYRLGGPEGIVLEKRIWMVQGRNTTCIQYRILRTTTREQSGLRRSGITGALSANIKHLHSSAQYTQKTSRTLSLTLLPFAAYNSDDQPSNGSDDCHFQVLVHQTAGHTYDEISTSTIHLPQGVAGYMIKTNKNTPSYHILAVGQETNEATFIPTGVWYWHIMHKQDAAAGQPALGNLYLPGVIRATLNLDENAALTIVISAEELSSQLYQREWIQKSHEECVGGQQQRLHTIRSHQQCFHEGEKPSSTISDPYPDNVGYLYELLQAGERFFVQKALPHRLAQDSPLFSQQTEQHTLILANFYTMDVSTRDTLIALPGLTLGTGRYKDALQILRLYSQYFTGGLLPDRLPTIEKPLVDSDYGSADTTLWYFYTLDYYLQITRDDAFLEEIFHLLKECINWYIRGTYNDIKVDLRDGLLMTFKAGKALTWMNCQINGIPVTARSGKAVEINALWYYALSLMCEWSERLAHNGYLGHNTTFYQKLQFRCQKNFQQRFWYQAGRYLYDVVDGSAGDDSSIRPNQIFALSLRYSVLDPQYRRNVFDMVTRHLLTPYGLRTLAPEDPAYHGYIGEQQEEQQHALHQGSVWPWLIGPYINAMLRSGEMVGAEQNTSLYREMLWRKGLGQLEHFQMCLQNGLLGMCAGTMDGDAPHRPGSSLASAMSSGELLRIYNTLIQLRIKSLEQVISR